MKLAKSYSIRTKLFFRISAVIIAAFFVFIGAIYLEFRIGAENVEEASVIEIATQIKQNPERYTFAGLSPGASGGERISIAGVSIATLSGDVIHKAETWLPDVVLTPPLKHGDRSAILGRDVDTGAQLFVFGFLMDGADLELPDAEYVVHVARPTTNFEPIVRSFLYLNLAELWWVFVLLVAASILITKRTIESAMRSVNDAAAVADSIDIDRLDVRLPIDDLPVEVRPLATKTNDALDRLEEIVRAERSFTSSAAHELRTPLAVLRSKLEELPEGAARRDVLRRVDTMSRVVGQLLQLARVDAWHPDPSNMADLSTVARDVVRDFTPGAVRSGGDVSFLDEAAQSWNVDRVLLEILLLNLLENALKYTGAPASISVTVNGNGLMVDDNGPGISEKEHANAVKPFWRGDRSREDGVGIGLALASRIAEHLGGHLEIGKSPAGGCRITLARAPSAA